MTTTNWTKFSDRLPPEDYEAVFVETKPGHIAIWERDNTMNRTWKDYAEFTDKWHPITYPELPKEETQEERDDVAARGTWASITALEYLKPSQYFNAGFHSALAYERAEVAKELSNGSSPSPHDNTFITRLRRRCGLDK